MAQKYLITSALPYVNGELHLGHLVGCWLPSDVYARFCRAMGRDVLFICGADEHGTTAIVGAAKENMPVKEYNDKYYAKHLRAVSDFNLSFDFYGRTHTQLQEILIHDLFKRLDDQGLIEERETIQPFSVDDNMFLADRQLVGTCPNCGYEKARGDQCDKCSATYEATELINPRSTISGSTNIEMRPTKNLFFLASKMQDEWKKWLEEHAPKWSKTASSIARGWANEGLIDTSITRDLSWGIPVNKPGYENKVFYVWFDAPWGYVSISQAANKDWETWWKNPDCFYAQFMAKDNVKFHSVFFPEQELAMHDNWKTVDMLKSMNFLNFEDGKFSKSEGNGIFLDQAIDIAPSDTWRYSLMASAPETDDYYFKIDRFADVVNKDLNGILGNFVSRVCKLSAKNFGNFVPKSGDTDSELVNQINEKLNELTTSLEKCEFRNAIFALRSLWAIGNEYMTEKAPWALVKDGNLVEAEHVLNNCFQLIDFYSRVSAPFIPNTAEKMQNIFAEKHDLSWPKEFEKRILDGTEFTIPENLFERIDDDKVKFLTEKFCTKKDDKPHLTIVKIVEIQDHPERENLHVLTITDGNQNYKVVCGAPNVRENMLAVFAPIGAILPKTNKPIKPRNVAGVESAGMLCSGDELNISDDDTCLYEISDETKLGTQF
ncbi:MAG: methionine--tRNA ligase [Alphaproteobacteria bacterium]|nr:methionine--tRNA ligase [Alphaproteobacteria bacterium]